ncbi:MAG: cytosolic protein [Anaerolineaceae bacterium]|nr:cytosolic protein [Anaerolineaceae bacterium]
MNEIDLNAIQNFVNDNITVFHQQKIKSLEKLKLATLLKKNPYLFKAKNISIASDLITDILTAFLSSSEEKLFGDFLEALAIFVASQTCDAKKSAAPGIDMEFLNGGAHYVVSIKSGTNWGNSSQQRRQEDDFKDAVKRLKQSQHSKNVQAVLGICYGKTRTSYVRGYQKIVGQNFWYFISENENLYIDLVEPIGYRAKEHTEAFAREKSRVINVFTQEFMAEFCTNGAINWAKLVEFNSGNLDLPPNS